jgi:hypothetical protein
MNLFTEKSIAKSDPLQPSIGVGIIAALLRGIRTKRNYLFLTTGLLLSTLFFINTSVSYGRIVTGLLAREAKNHALILDITSPNLKRNRLSGSRILGILPSGFFLEAKNPSISLAILPLIYGTKKVTFSALPYEGELTMVAAQNFFSNKTEISGQATGIACNRHPFFQTIGVSEGQIDFSLHKIKLLSGFPIAGEAEIKVKGLTRLRSGIKESLRSTSFATTTQLVNLVLNSLGSTLAGIHLNVDLSFFSDKTEITTITLDSPLAIVKGSGKLTLENSVSNINLLLETTLTKQGQKRLMPLLNSLAGSTVNDKFTGTVTGSVFRPVWKFVKK